jgi:polar amino acid transport system permease protein
MMRWLLSDSVRLGRIGRALGTVTLIAVLTLVNQKPPVVEGLDPWFLRLSITLTLTALIAANIRALGLLPRAAQIWAVWIELFLGLMAFFWSFDLSFAFIARKIGFLITQGVAMTLYISALSILIATAIAQVGAVAKLSRLRTH